MKTGTKSCGFAALAFALVTLSGCGGGSSSSSSTTTTANTAPGPCAAATTSSNQWAWVCGNNTALSLGNYGTQGTAASSNQPPSRYGAAYWTDAAGNFYVFGGIQNGTTPLNFLNDLWRYSPSSNQWTWLSGTNKANTAGLYGSLNTSTATNAPGARYGSSFWRDSSGSLYLFGGVGFDTNGAQAVYMNDLWKYNISNNQWTWIGGSSSGANGTIAPSPGIYGTLGTGGSTNLPGVRANAVSITDATGNFWLFGGIGADSAGTFGNLSDLWKYSTTTNQWTWVAGPNLGNQNAANSPSRRYNASGWADSSGNLWLFGGSVESVTSTSAGPQSQFTPINDLWKFSSSTSQWTLVSGSSTAGAAGTYGTKGVAAPGNTPGARAFSMEWVDSSNNLYLFGGGGLNGASQIAFNDLWKYSTSTGQWTWLNGTNGSAGAGVYGSQYTSAPNNVPGGRLQGATWSDSSGNLWLFGGIAFDSSPSPNLNFNPINDLWKYQP